MNTGQYNTVKTKLVKTNTNIQFVTIVYAILMYLTLPIPCISESYIEIKIKLNFYFHTSLWCLKRFYEGL